MDNLDNYGCWKKRSLRSFFQNVIAATSPSGVRANSQSIWWLYSLLYAWSLSTCIADPNCRGRLCLCSHWAQLAVVLAAWSDLGDQGELFTELHVIPADYKCI